MNDDEVKKIFENSFLYNLDSISLMSKEEEEEMKKKEQKEKEYRKQTHYEASGIGEKYFSSRIEQFDDYTDELKKTLQVVKKYIEDINKGICRTLWICGNNGTGKTTLASYIVRECWGTYRNFYDIDDDLKIADNFKSNKDRKEVFKFYKNCTLLVIDEVARFQTKQAVEILFHILNDRHQDGKPTVLITNLSNQELKEYLGKALTDRFIEDCTSIQLEGGSYRIKIRRTNEG